MKKLFENWRKYTKLTEATYAGAEKMINEDKEPFFVLSAFRNERGSKYSRGNISAASDLKNFFKQKGLSYTIVEGGYTEKMKDEEGNPIKTTDEEGNEVDKTLDIVEESYLVFGNVPHYGDEGAAIKDIQKLFELAKQACLVDSENPQESFSFGYPRTVEDPVEGQRKEMFIALYKNDAPAPGPANAYTEWGGPWTSFDEFMADEGAYTKVRSTKGTFAERKLKEARSGTAKSVTDGNSRQAKVKYWTKMKNRWLAENRRKRETSK